MVIYTTKDSDARITFWRRCLLLYKSPFRGLSVAIGKSRIRILRTKDPCRTEDSKDTSIVIREVILILPQIFHGTSPHIVRSQDILVTNILIARFYCTALGISNQ
jgi:hypothetical protein